MSPFDPKDVEQLQEPAFLAHLKATFPGEIVPDPEDYDTMRPTTPERAQAELAEAYQRAQVRKLLRLYRRWKLGQN